MRKVTVELKIKMLIYTDEDKEISDVIDEMEYDFTYTEPGAEIVNTDLCSFWQTSRLCFSISKTRPLPIHWDSDT